MAKEERKEKEEEKIEGEQTAKPGGKSPKMLIIALAAVVVLGGAGFYVWNSGMLKGGGKERKKVHAAQGAPKAIEIGPIRSMDTFIVNLADPLGKRYLKVKMDLEMSDEKSLPEIDKRLPQLRDTILTTLSSKNYEDISTLDGKMQLRAEIMAMLNQYLKTGKITNIYFTEFIVQ
jgi:flagellar FliL protein